MVKKAIEVGWEERGGGGQHFWHRTPVLPVYFIILEDMVLEGRVQLWNILSYKSENIMNTLKYMSPV